MTSVIILTRNYAYWGERPIEDAIRLMYRGKIEVLKTDETRIIRSGVKNDGSTTIIPMPLVARLHSFTGIKVKSENVPWSKEAVFRRDDFCCQYWHRDRDGNKIKHRCSREEITLDHVMPKIRGGRNTYENTVTACRHCNTVIKRGRTPKEAGLELMRVPEAPKRKRGDMIIMTFSFDPSNRAHKAFQEIMGS